MLSFVQKKIQCHESVQISTSYLFTTNRDRDIEGG